MKGTQNMTKPSKFLEPLAVAVASGNSIKDSSAVCGCSIQCAYNLSATAEFRSRVSEIRTEVTSQAVGRLTDASVRAVATIVALMGPENEPSVRLNASKAILLQLGPLSELGELRQRIDRLESSPRI
jgi:hypothetical protein